MIDWQHADAQSPPLEDLLHLLFTRKWLLSFYDPGRHVAALLQQRYSRQDRTRIARYLSDLGLDVGAMGLLALLYWVRYLDGWEASEGPKRGWYRRSYTRVQQLLTDDLESRLDRLGPWISET